MSEQTVIENLLGSIPVGEEIKDPRENDYDATLKDVEVVEQKNGHSLRLVFGDIEDANGRSFEHKENVTIPTSEHVGDLAFIQDIFLRWAQGLEVIPRTQRSAVLADTEEHRGVVLNAFKTKIGGRFPITLYFSKGFIRGRVNRRK